MGASDIQGQDERAGTVQSGEEKVWRNLIRVYKYQMWGGKEDKARCFSVVSGIRTRHNKQKLKYNKFYLNRRKFFYFLM